MLQFFDDKTGGQQGTLRPPAGKRAFVRFAGPAVAIVLIAYAAYVLFDMATKISLYDIQVAIRATEQWRILAAFGITGLGILSLCAYDVLGVKVIRPRPRVGFWRATVASGIANIFANSMGFPLITGGTARYRIYSMGGLDFAAVGKIIALSWVTMWAGIAVVLGLFLMFEPLHDRPVFLSHAVDRTIGATLVLGIIAAVVWVARKRRAVRLGGWLIRLPNAPLAIAMIFAGAMDLLTAAATLYVLLPPDAVPDISVYVVTYAAALVFGAAANTPGGLGVFEATIATGLGITDRPDVAAALILFRLIYFVAPLALALLVMGLVEWRHRRIVARQARLAGAVTGIDRND